MTDDTVLLQLTDRIAIEDLLTRYATACDEKNWALYQSVFADTAWIDYSRAYGTAGGRDEITAWMEAACTFERVPHTQHLLTNFQVSVDGENAAGRVQYINPDVHQDTNGERELLFNGGYYRFNTDRTGGAWKLNRLEATIIWSHRGTLCELTQL